MAPESHAPDVGTGIPPGTWGRLLAVMERLAASSDLAEVLRLIVDSMRDCLNAERASVFEYDRDRRELFASSAHGVDGSLRFSADLGLAGEAARTRRIINVPDCYADPRFNRDIDRRTGFVTRCMLTVPLVGFDGELEGVAQVLNKRTGSGPIFDAADEAIARALASQAAVAIRRARLIEAERRKDKMEADLRVARQMQAATLPRELPRVPGYDLAAENRQAEETGGDSYDLVPLATPGAPNGATGPVLVLMADASGHGVGPAISVTQVQAMLRMAARLGAALEDIVLHLNALMIAALPPGRFVTAFVGVLDPATHRVRYVSAGQSPVLVVRGAAAGALEERSAGTAPLGLDAVIPRPVAEELALGPGDLLLLLSDGYYECPSAAGTREQLGVGRVVEAARQGLVQTGTANRAAAVLEALRQTVATFSGGRPAIDDQTAVIIYRRA